MLVYNGPMAKPEPGFELNDTTMERIVFAMEDQTRSRLVDLRTGELATNDEGHLDDFLAPPPAWTAADGFKLMEGYCARLKNLELKRSLVKALSRGKGVFKAFKQVLSEYPEEEALYREYKNNFLKRYIESWMDEMRESVGLARLGPEPEEYDDLVDQEFQIESGKPSTLDFSLGSLVAEACAESMAWLPAAAALMEKRDTQEYFHRLGEMTMVRYIRGAGGQPIAAAAGAVEIAEGRPLGMIRFLYVDAEFRSLGFELRLLESLGQWFRENGIEHCLLSSRFLRPELGDQFIPRGLKAIGSEYLLG
jgi:GNAT superfamily N-acetyltransferase